MQVEQFFNYYLYTERIDRGNYSLCKLKFVDSILHINLVEFLISINDMIRLLDMIYSYIVFGGYNTGTVFDFNLNFSHYEFRLTRDVNGYKDILSIDELKGRNRLTRVKFIFDDEMSYECNHKSIFDLFVFLYESFLYDKVSLADLAPDFDNE